MDKGSSQPQEATKPIAQQTQHERSLAIKLRELYKSQDTLPKLIDADEIPQQSLEQYYIKLQIILNQDSANEKQAAAHDKVVGEKRSVEIENIFGAVGDSKEANKEANKLLIVGAAGVGKTTLLHYMSYRWSKGDLWGDKFDYVFRVKLKELLSESWKNDYDPKTELRQDKLGCFLHYCLGQESGRLEIQPSDIMAIANKNKVLLLLDGYDEVAHLAGNRDYQDIMRAIDSHQNVIMSSRPNALNDQMREKFDRQVENQGLGFEGTKKYIDIHFGASGEESLKQQLTSFLTTNSQVAEMCQIPINLALVSLVWRDPKTREQLTSNEGFNLGTLYEEVIVWLGKRYLEKFAGKSHQEAQNLSNEQIFLQPEMEFLTKVAYDSFVRTGKLVEKEVIKDNLHSHKIELAKVNKWGLMKPEGEGIKLLDMNYQFIHLTFQEYLTAYYLKNQLASDRAKTEAAMFIGSHRNEPKYLMTLKFLAGLVTVSEDQQLVTRFWEAVSCNVDGVLELGMEGKISLLMHLLAQSKNKGEFDPRIPNLEQMQKLIDEAVGADFTKWTGQIIASTYLPRSVVEKINLVLTGSLDKVEHKELTASIEVATALANRIEFGDKTAIFEQLAKLISESKDWQLRKFALEKLAQMVDGSIAIAQLKDSLKLFNDLIDWDDNLKWAANGVLIAMVKVKPIMARNVLFSYTEIIRNNDTCKVIAIGLPEIVKFDPRLVLRAFLLLAKAWGCRDWMVMEAVTKSLSQIVKAIPDKSEALTLLQDAITDPRVKNVILYNLPEMLKVLPDKVGVFKFLQQVLNDLEADSHLKEAAAKNLAEIVKVKPELTGQAFDLLQQVLNDPDPKAYFKKAAIESLPEIVKAMPELAWQAFDLLQQVVKDTEADSYLKQVAAKSLPEIVKAMPDKVGVFKFLQQVLNDLEADSHLKQAAAESLSEIVKAMPELAKQVFGLLQQVLNDPDPKAYFKTAVAESLPEIVKATPELAGQAFDLLQQVLNDPKADIYLKKAVVKSLTQILKVKPELAGQAFDLLQQVLNDLEADSHLKQAAAKDLAEIVKVKPGLAGQAFTLFQQVLNDPKASEYLKQVAVESMSEIVKAMPELAGQAFTLFQQAFTLFQQLFDDPKVDDLEDEMYLKQLATESLPKIVPFVPFQDSFALLNHKSREMRSATKKRMLEKLKNPLDYKEVSGLVKIIEQTAKSTEEDDQELNISALKALKTIASNLDEEGVKWVNEHFDKLPDVDATRMFLKVLFHQTLSDGKITEVESQFLIKAILKYGFTAVINPSEGKIIFEDVAYKLHDNSKEMLGQIALEVLNHSQDSLVVQYRTHQPLFKNTGLGLPVAAADVYDGSIVDGAELEHNHWQLWLLNLSDHNGSEPTKSFLLLEKRAEDGRHIIHKLEVQDGKLQNLEFTELPQNVGSELRHKVFGDMEYVKVAPRYYGSAFKVSLQDGDRLIAHGKEQQIVAGANEYEIMRNVLASVTKSSGGQAASWQEYSGQEGCKIFDKITAFKLTGEKAEEVRRNSTIIKGQIKLAHVIEQQEQMGERVNKLESLQKEAAETVQVLKNTINSSESVKERDKTVLQNRIEEIAQKLPELANQADLEKLITGMKDLLSQGQITKQRLAALEEDVDSMLDKQEQMEDRVNKLELLQQEAAQTIEGLKNAVSTSESVKERDKKALQNRIEEMAQKLPSLANQADLEKLVAGMKDLMSQGQITKQRLAALEDDIDAMVEQQGGNNVNVAMVAKILYDNPILNHPELLKSLLGSKLFCFDQLLNLSARLAPELLLSVIESGDNELLIGTLMSVNDSFDGHYLG